MIDIGRIPLHSIIPDSIFQRFHTSVIHSQWVVNESTLEDLGYHPSKIYTTDREYVGVGFLDMKFQHTFIFVGYDSDFVKVANFRTEDDSVTAAILLDKP